MFDSTLSAAVLCPSVGGSDGSGGSGGSGGRGSKGGPLVTATALAAGSDGEGAAGRGLGSVRLQEGGRAGGW
jgi:hypothetical protein